MGDNEAQVQGLVDAVPKIEPIVLESIEFYQVLGPHIVVGDLFTWIRDRATHLPSRPSMGAFLAQIDETYPAAEDDERNVINVSCVENLDRAVALLDYLGPNLDVSVEYCFPNYSVAQRARSEREQ